MTGLDYVKAAARDAGRGGGWTSGDGKPSTTTEEVKRIMLGPDAIRCRRCPDLFLTTGEEERPRPIHLCPDCRRDVEQEAELNDLPVTVGDDDLTEALASVARAEARMVRAARPRRVDRLHNEVAALRRELWAKAGSKGEVAA